MVLTESDIQKFLSEYMSDDEAARRAQWISEDMRTIGFELQLSNENPRGMWQHLGAIPQAEYVVPSDFDINSAQDDRAMSGSFSTCGNLLRLSQCVKTARTLLPSKWPTDFAKELSGPKHLDTLNEIWWLKFWRDVQQIERAPKTDPNASDFDWFLRFQSGLASCCVNLEVKRRTGNLNSNFKRGRPNISLGEIAHKFGAVAEDTANVVALTAFVPLAEDVWRWVIDWFEKKPHIHGLLAWIEGNLGTAPLLKLFKPRKRWVEFLLNEPEPEDLKVASRTCGTLCKRSDAPAFVSKLAERENRPTIYRP